MVWTDLLSPLWLAIIIPSLALVLGALWWMFGPRHGRTLQRLRRLMKNGQWSEALQQVKKLRKRKAAAPLAEEF